ncbi:MAG: beta-alanine degradation protein BauB [Bryobacterales bacterium]|jgi:hypothetical protein|nr:beta-alanine degradation protein BauB [Bryobacterales bacterium]
MDVRLLNTMTQIPFVFLFWLASFHNSNVIVSEHDLVPGARLQGERPAIVVAATGTLGQVFYRHGPFVNDSTTTVHVVRVQFAGEGSDQTLGTAGLSPNYKVLIENRFARVYEIRIPAGTNEPQHTHRARVVVCLSGAELRHLMPDGRTETSTLHTGEVVWRTGGTHIGQNLGQTDLWAIAVEPK